MMRYVSFIFYGDFKVNQLLEQNLTEGIGSNSKVSVTLCFE